MLVSVGASTSATGLGWNAPKPSKVSCREHQVGSRWLLARSRKVPRTVMGTGSVAPDTLSFTWSPTPTFSCDATSLGNQMPGPDDDDDDACLTM